MHGVWNLSERARLLKSLQFDKFGNTGGCQATYTVIPPSSLPTCANVTLPLQLGVQGKVDNGPISRFGWIDQVGFKDLTISMLMSVTVHVYFSSANEWNSPIYSHCKLV